MKALQKFKLTILDERFGLKSQKGSW